MKTCNKCKTDKEISEFYKKSERRGGLTSFCKDCIKVKQIAYRRNNPEKSKDIDLYQSFGIRMEDYKGIYDAQDGCCAICKRHSSEFGRALDVDHDHENGDIRGLLCSTCNTVIGKIKDNPKWVSNCATYLKKKENGIIYLRKVG